MDTPNRNATIPGRTAEGKAGVSEVKSGDRYRSEPFKPAATLLLDVLPAEGAKSADAGQAGVATDSPEASLRQLLINTEASAERTQSAKMKWQLASLVLGMLIAATAVVIGWLYFEMNMTGTQRGRLAVENQSLQERLNTAGSQITWLKGEVDNLLSRNLELVSENSQLKSQKQAAAATVSAAASEAQQRPVEKRVASNFPSPAESSYAKVTAVAEQALDAGRVEAIRKGTFPKGATKDELIAALGEPDRIYKSRGYEQLVYFDKKPGRFWFIGNRLVQVSQ